MPSDRNLVLQKSATIRDVARLAGVGVGTASRVINNSPQVSSGTRASVLAAMAQLDFTPSPVARRLALGKTLAIAAIVPFFTRPSPVERLRGIESLVVGSGYDLNVYNVETPERRDFLLQDLLRPERADGILILSMSPRDADVDRLASSTVPIVLIDANCPALPMLNRVVGDDRAGGFAATQHLIDLGHRRIGIITDPLEDAFNFTSNRDRYAGYLAALAEAGLPFTAKYHAYGQHGRAEARRLAAAMLAAFERPTAIFAVSDTQALGVLEAARDLQLAVPGDLSVVGFDDIEIAEYLGLTTIRQQLFESGRRGMELLLGRLKGLPHDPVCEVLPSEVIVRGTTAPPRA